MPIKNEIIVARKFKNEILTEEFKQLSYSKWAISELVNYISDNSSRPPVVLVEEFANIMDRYSKENSETGKMFLIGRDAVLNILDALIASRWSVLK